MKLKDKICIVTSVASGIGKEIALTFARDGGKVVIADLNKAAAQFAADEITPPAGLHSPSQWTSPTRRRFKVRWPV